MRCLGMRRKSYKSKAPQRILKHTSCKTIQKAPNWAAILTNSDKSPSQGARDDGGVDEPGVRMVAEGQRAQVEEVDDQDELSPDEMAADEEHDEGEVQQVVRDEMGTNGAGRVHLLDVAREEVHHIANLEQEQDDAGVSVLVTCENLKRAPKGLDLTSKRIQARS